MKKSILFLASAFIVLMSFSQAASAQETTQKKGFFHKFSVGLTAVDFGYCPSSYDRNNAEVNTDFYYNIGASLKFGDYLAPVQAEAGILPGMIFRKVDLIEDKTNENDFRLVSFIRVKANICDAFKGSKVFAAASGFYNIIDEHELNYSAGISAGLAWKHLECSLFYRLPIGDSDGYPKGYVGTTISWYFGL